MSGEQPILKASNVKLDTIAAMKIMKLGNDNPTANQYGYLLGIIESETIEVTNCFPIIDVDEEQDQQYEYLDYAKKHHLDFHKLGLYVITDQNRHFTLDQFEDINRLQFYVKYAFVLVYSLQLAKSGHSQPFQAFVINEKYAEIYSKDEIPVLNIKNDKIYRQLPLELLKTPLTQAFLYQYRASIEEKFKNEETKFTSNIQNYGRQLIETIEEQVTLSDKINSSTQNKKEGDKQPELLEYLISMNKLYYLAEAIKRETQYTLETEQVLTNILKQ
ncbi:unnamed protein product [Paramecium pentaurelia]|uniref:JAB1/MPN/MOV34 metalloenzyme domain-containing protein n=1 Tax=Paramecium pentaurelia TaxID=43138 RepID=A0A8S1S9Y1_9CILI|nr:unnamed protein product [Paramecium pentaurelia]